MLVGVRQMQREREREVETISVLSVRVAVRHPQHHLSSAPCNVPCQTLFKILDSICACYSAFIKAWL